MEDLKFTLDADEHQKKLCELCEPQQPGIRSQPKITWFEVPTVVLDILTALNRIRPSVVFEQKWRKIGRAYMRENEDVTMEDIVDNVWLTAYSEVRQIVESLEKGTITFHIIDEIFGDFRQNYKVMKAEIQAMCAGVQVTKHTWIDKKLKQVEEYQKLSVYREGALTMKKIKEGFKLQGDFQILDILISAVSVLHWKCGVNLIKDPMKIVVPS